MTGPTRLRPGDLFPELTVAIPGGRSLRLPGALAGHFSVILFYRGSWCPYCNAQLRAFQRSLDRLTGLGVLVAALSVDDEATTKDLIARHSLQFPVGHSADAPAVAAATGAFVNDDPVYLQSTGFVLGPSGRVAVSVYSSGAIGRLVPDDVIGLVRYLRDHAHSRQPSSASPTALARGIVQASSALAPLSRVNHATSPMRWRHVPSFGCRCH
jgi:peroxiredoxin